MSLKDVTSGKNDLKASKWDEAHLLRETLPTVTSLPTLSDALDTANMQN